MTSIFPTMDPRARASVDTLKFIVVGGGIAGLTCAYLLKKAGHRVVVLERSPRIGKMPIHHGGLRVPPNMTRLLQELPGTGELLKTKATKITGVLFHQCDSNNTAPELVGKLVYAEEMMSDLGADLYTITHKDFHDYLLSLCDSIAVELHYDFEVEDIITGIPGPTVIGKSGERVTGDIVIGADGKNSVTRKVLLNEQVEAEDEAEEADSLGIKGSFGLRKPAFPPLNALIGATMSIPISLIQSDPELTSLVHVGEQEIYARMFMGNGTNIFISQYGPDRYELALTYSTPPAFDVNDGDWLSGGTPTKDILEKVEEYDFRIKKLIQLVPTCYWNVQNVHTLLRYISKLDQVVVIGDAAHATYINGTHNTGAAFEDAFTLGQLFSRLTPADSKLNASLLLNGYQQIRQKRTHALEKSSMDTMILMGLVPGPERDGRNNGLRLTISLEGPDDATLERVWTEYSDQFDYESRDNVAEWWMNWARPIKSRANLLIRRSY
ncbi:hypothetical protein BDP27DRAFT_1330079 [Rhodocollybia butyracea]|uniref:FAD-binding domain-containing protein n=1 Tax=Rhodocollybia butyracea TaxID=206335 RepID=A0A9P5U6F8_9AGAR|nr:hypothetical protein BDP27DRAFT_1330079 [Rhodocollybia butyracea]